MPVIAQTSFSIVQFNIDPSATTVGTDTTLTATLLLPSGMVYNDKDVIRITLPSGTTGAW